MPVRVAVHGEGALVALTTAPRTVVAAGTTIRMQPMSPEPSVSVRRIATLVTAPAVMVVGLAVIDHPSTSAAVMNGARASISETAMMTADSTVGIGVLARRRPPGAVSQAISLAWSPVVSHSIGSACRGMSGVSLDGGPPAMG
jgi:hypothetical protein